MRKNRLINIVVDKPIQFARTLLKDNQAVDLFLEIVDYLIDKDPFTHRTDRLLRNGVEQTW